MVENKDAMVFGLAEALAVMVGKALNNLGVVVRS